MKKYLVFIFIWGIFLWFPMSNGAEDNKVPPKIVDTKPKNNAPDVRPSLTMITVTFSKSMMDKSWSWSYEDKDSFPQTTGAPYYMSDNKTCVLPVKLEPNKKYVLWINTARHKNFKDEAGNPIAPYKLSFTTGPK